MTITVGRLAPGDQWDCTLLDQLFANELYPTGLEFRRVEGYPATDGCILLVPGRYWEPQRINEAIGRYKWLLLFRSSDEEDTFDVGQIVHKNARFWVQTPRRDYPDARVFGVGFPPHFNDMGELPEKDTEVFLAAQNTHQRRHECFAAVADNPDWDILATEGFTQGHFAEEYRYSMKCAKVAPAPSGAISVDSFRFWEALESHAIPIADTVSPVDGKTDYWHRLLPDAPFPILANYESLPAYITEALEGWPANANRITAWWMRTKRTYARWLVEDLQQLGALP